MVNNKGKQMSKLRNTRVLPGVVALPLLLALAGCNTQLLTPQGAIGVQEKNLILIAMGLMLLVVIPVIILTLVFAWRYRAGNSKATYLPTWAHSTRVEVVVWAIPCVIVGILALLIQDSTHALDPYKPIESKVAPLRVQVVALNWKWLFIYPDLGVASVNQLHMPVDTPVEFTLTADSLMNSFFIPRLGSQVYAMAGMQTKLHLIANSAGVYDGRSAAYSGAGFSDMHFDTVAESRAQFDRWLLDTRAAGKTLDLATYGKLAAPGNGAPVSVYAGVVPGLFDRVVNQYMHGATTIADELCVTPPNHLAEQ
jgi:cytochrome o ubiquinol oxidase subunit 2